MPGIDAEKVLENVAAHYALCIASVFVAPDDGSDDVVRDAKVWVAVSRRADAKDVTLIDELGRAVPGRWTSIVDDDEIAVFHPERQLAPRTTYRVMHVDNGVLSSFTTGERFSEGPPVLGAIFIDSVTVREAGSCARSGDDDGHIVVASLRAEHDGVFLAADVDGTSTFDIERFSGDVVHFVEGDTVSFGDQLCIGHWPAAAPLTVGRARLGAFDMAGNFSGWSDEILVEVPEAVELPRANPPTEGCASAGAPLVVVLAAFIRRRRTR